MSNLKIVGASWLQGFKYCEYKFYLHKVKGIDVKITKPIQRGIEIHEAKEQEFRKEATPVTWKELLEAEELTITREADFNKQLGDIMLLGRIDEITVDKEKICIIDDKPNAFPYDATKLQIYAYCYLFRETFKEQPKPVIATLRDRDTSQVIWQQEFSKAEEQSFLKEFYRMRAILLQKEDPVPTKSPNKCRACQFKDTCEFSMVKQSASYQLQ